MNITHYDVEHSMHGDLIVLYWNDGRRRKVLLHQSSGNIMGCEKPIVHPFSITHTGIYLGTCWNTGEDLFIHSHPKHGQVVLGNRQDFCQDRPMWVEETTCVNTRAQIINVSLAHLVNGTAYHLLKSNCQHLTSLACNNQAKSKDLQTVGLMLGGLGLLGLLWAGTRKAS